MDIEWSHINQPGAYQCVSIQCSFYYTSFILLRLGNCSDISCLYIYTGQNINLLYNEVHLAQKCVVLIKNECNYLKVVATQVWFMGR